MKKQHLLLLLLIASCHSFNKTSKETINLINETEINPLVLDLDIVMTPPAQLLVEKDFLVFINPGGGHPVLFLNKNTKDIFLWGQTGSGPDDFISPKCIEQNNNLTLYDVNLHKAIEFTVDMKDSISLIPQKRQYIQPDSISLIDLHTMSNGFTVGAVGIGGEKMFALLNKEMKIIRTFGEPPIEGLPKENFLSVYGTLASFGDKLFFSCLRTGYIACYTIRNNGNVAKEWEHYLTVPLYDANFDKWTPDNKYGAFDVKATKEYVFVAFSGKILSSSSSVLPQNLLIFNHSGKLIKNIRCKDSSIGKFAIDGDTIYALGEDQLIKINWKSK